jgi:hypothetical protein
MERAKLVLVASVSTALGLGASACHVSTRTDQEVAGLVPDVCADADQKFEFGVIQTYEDNPAVADPFTSDAGSDGGPTVVDAGDFPASAFPNGGVCIPVPPAPAMAPPSAADWWPYGDYVPGASHSAYVDRILVGGGATAATNDAEGGPLPPLLNGGTPGARCGSTKALVLEAKRHRDWGAGFGTNFGRYGGQPQYGRAQPGDYDLDSGRSVPGSPTLTTNRLNCTTGYAPRNINADLGEMNVDVNGSPLLTGAAQGLSFWAKADENSSVSFMVRLLDQRTYADVQPYISLSPDSVCVPPLSAQCKSGDKVPFTPDGAAPAVCDPRGYDLLSEDDSWSDASVPDDGGLDPKFSYGNFCSLCEDAGNEDRCGNFFEAPVTITHEWALYRISFGQFRQGVNGRRFSQIDRQHLRLMEFKFPKDSDVKIWIYDIGFYRRR